MTWGHGLYPCLFMCLHKCVNDGLRFGFLVCFFVGFLQTMQDFSFLLKQTNPSIFFLLSSIFKKKKKKRKNWTFLLAFAEASIFYWFGVVLVLCIRCHYPPVFYLFFGIWVFSEISQPSFQFSLFFMASRFNF